jgi:Peptidase family M3
MVTSRFAGKAVFLSMLVVSTVAAGAPVDPLANKFSPRSYLTACESVAAIPPERERWSAASELLWSAHPDPVLRSAARTCQQLLDRYAKRAPRAVESAGVFNAKRRLALRIAGLERDFERNLTERQPALRFTRREVDGFPAEWLDEYRVKGRDAYVFGVGLADYYPFMSLVRSSAARKRMYYAHANRGGRANVRILREIVELRRKFAALEGTSYATYIGERNGVPHARDSQAFLAQMSSIINPAFLADINDLRRIIAPQPLHRWDVSFALEQAREQAIGQGDMNASARIPAEVLPEWMRSYYERIAGVRIEPAERASWHLTVPCFVVRSVDGTVEFGRLCLDLLPRPGKYYNYATYVIPHSRGEPATAVLLANLQQQHLTPDEVERTFGEYSVALSSLTTRVSPPRDDAARARLQAVQREFFGALAFTHELIGIPGKHAAIAIDPERLRSIRANRDFAFALARGRELLFAKFDSALSSAEASLDLVATWRALEDATGLPHEPGSYFPSRMNQLTGGSAGMLHFALWAQAAATAALERFENKTLTGDSLSRIRTVFFEPSVAMPLAQRLEVLLDEPFSLEPFRRRIESNTVQAVAARGTRPATGELNEKR